jgi:hypothetical protein
MFVLAMLALTASMASVLVSVEQQRLNERELVFVGRELATAIERYHALLPQHAKRYPARLDELLRDDRVPTIQRHLRRIYIDPMTGGAQWGLVRRPDGGIVGVHSLSERRPFERRLVNRDFPVPQSRTYREWLFMAASPNDAKTGD